MERYVDIGKIVDRFKVENQVKVESYMDNVEDFINIDDFYIKTLTGFKKLNLVFDFSASEYLIYRVEGMLPELIEHLKGKTIYTKYENLPKPKEGEYYVSDLEECRVFEINGNEIGKVERVIENAKMFFLEFSEYIIPFSDRYIKEVSIEEKKIVLSEVFSKEKDFFR